MVKPKKQGTKKEEYYKNTPLFNQIYADLVRLGLHLALFIPKITLFPKHPPLI